MFRLCSVAMHSSHLNEIFPYVELILQWYTSVSIAQSTLFRPFRSKEYYIESNSFARTYAQAEGTCNASEAIVALVNRIEIGQFLLGEIGNMTVSFIIFQISTVFIIYKELNKNLNEVFKNLETF